MTIENGWLKLPFHVVMRNAAEKWVRTAQTCGVCGRAIFRHTCAPGSYYTYIRCPTCQENHITRDSIRAFDRSADRMIDAAAAMFPTITEPKPHPDNNDSEL